MSTRLLVAHNPGAERFQIQRVLSHRGCTVQVANGGVECLEKLRRASFDLVILELELLWGGGDGVVELIRNGDVPWLPVALLGEAASLTRQLTTRPVVSCHPKPVQLNQLLAAVQYVAQTAGFQSRKYQLAANGSHCSQPSFGWAYI